MMYCWIVGDSVHLHSMQFPSLCDLRLFSVGDVYHGLFNAICGCFLSAVCIMVYLYCLVEESSYPPRRGELSFLLSVIWMFGLLPTLFFSCLVLSYLVLVCLTLSYLILSCLVLSCRVSCVLRLV